MIAPPASSMPERRRRAPSAHGSHHHAWKGSFLMSVLNCLSRGVLPLQFLRSAAIVAAIFTASVASPVQIGAQAKPSPLVKKAGRYSVALRLPAEGLFAQMGTAVALHFS